MGVAGAVMRLPSASLPVERVAPSTRKVTVCRSPYWAVTVWFSAATMELAVISVPSSARPKARKCSAFASLR